MWWSLLEMVSQVSRRWLWRGLWRVVACNVTQGFGKNDEIGEAGYREVALEVLVERVT